MEDPFAIVRFCATDNCSADTVLKQRTDAPAPKVTEPPTRTVQPAAVPHVSCPPSTMRSPHSCNATGSVRAVVTTHVSNALVGGSHTVSSALPSAEGVPVVEADRVTVLLGVYAVSVGFRETTDVGVLLVLTVAAADAVMEREDIGDALMLRVPVPDADCDRDCDAVGVLVACAEALEVADAVGIMRFNAVAQQVRSSVPDMSPA